MRLSSDLHIQGAHHTHMCSPTSMNRHTQAHTVSRLGSCVPVWLLVCPSDLPFPSVIWRRCQLSWEEPADTGRMRGRGGSISLCLSQRNPAVAYGDFLCSWTLSTTGLEAQRPPVAVSPPRSQPAMAATSCSQGERREERWDEGSPCSLHTPSPSHRIFD